MPTNITLLTSRTNFVVVHYHIFKNAGSSVEHVLEREFPGAFARLHGSSADSTLDARDLGAFLADHPNVRAVTSHHLRYPLPPSTRNLVIFDCCFLRHPLERLDSLYSYYSKINSLHPLCREAHRKSPADFMKYLLREAPHQISDMQVTQLANAGAFTRPANIRDLDRATEIMQDMALPGLVEMYAESMVAAEYFLNPAFPGIRLDCEPKNVSRQIELRSDAREQRLKARWGSEVYNDLARANEFDLELYARTSAEIRRRLLLVPSAAVRVEEFRRRSAAATAHPANVELVGA